MELPKINKEDLPKLLREVVGDVDVEFEPVVDPMDILSLNLDVDQYTREKVATAEELIKSRQKQWEYLRKARESEQA